MCVCISVVGVFYVGCINWLALLYFQLILSICGMYVASYCVMCSETGMVLIRIRDTAVCVCVCVCACVCGVYVCVVVHMHNYVGDSCE